MKHCRLTLDIEKVDALHKMYTVVIMKCENHVADDLLFAHTEEMQHQLKIMVAKDNYKNTLSFNKMDSIAFERLWKLQLLDLDEWHGEIIRSCLEKVNKFLADVKATTVKLN